jgi:ribosomal protein L37AE/L43A
MRSTDRRVMKQSEFVWRLQAEVKARQPYTCSHCGSGALCPVFAWDRRGTWQCVDCGRELCTAD